MSGGVVLHSLFINSIFRTLLVNIPPPPQRYSPALYRLEQPEIEEALHGNVSFCAFHFGELQNPGIS